MGAYPLFLCADWAALPADVEALTGELASLTLVSDPFADLEPQRLALTFPLCRRFKTHWTLDLAHAGAPSRHHRDACRQASRRLRVEHCPEPLRQLDEWLAVFACLVGRHDLRGLKAPSRKAFARQLTVPGLAMFRAELNGEAVGFQLWFVSGDVAYGHLMAATPAGYAAQAHYGMTAAAIEHFAGRVLWLDFGGAAGATDAPDSPLVAFKRGWCNGTRPTYLCGRILDPPRYRQLCAQAGGGDYFPAYRAGELTGLVGR